MMRRWPAGAAGVLGVATMAVLGPECVEAQVPPAERAALIDIYNSTNGAEWYNGTGWLGPAGTECTWNDVNCMSSTHVRELDLRGNNLVGRVPPSIGDLPDMLNLYLGGNQLVKVPSALGDLGGLGVLEMSGSKLAGTIPPELGNLHDAQALMLDQNQLSGEIPPELGSMSPLRYLSLAGNKLTGPVPSTLIKLTNLIRLDLRWNALHTDDPALLSFLNSKQIDHDWESTQTVAPTSFSISVIRSVTVTLTWTPIAYTGDTGGYRVLAATRSGGPYAEVGMTPDKTATGATIEGLSPATTYHFIVETQTNPHENNQNTVISKPTAETSATTLSPALSVGEAMIDRGEAGSVVFTFTGKRK